MMLWFQGRDNIEIAFMYSQCGNDWKQVSSDLQQFFQWQPTFQTYLIRWFNGHLRFFCINSRYACFNTVNIAKVGSASGPLERTESLCCTKEVFFAQLFLSDFKMITYLNMPFFQGKFRRRDGSAFDASCGN